jgi:DNA-binding CsgD family transcriptional regulator
VTLSKSEHSIAMAIGSGMSAKEIAILRGTSIKTVKNQKLLLYAKLRFSGASSAAVKVALMVAEGRLPPAREEL